MTAPSGSLVHLTSDRGVATITLDSPANRNALSRRLVTELAAHLETVRGDADVRGVVLTGTGTVFCAGADLAEAGSGGSAIVGGAGAPTFVDVLHTLWHLPKTVVVRLNGHVRAGGMGIVAAADIVVAPHDATLAFSEVRIGVAPAIIAVLCMRVMTPRAVHRYMLTGERFDAAEGLAAGLVSVAVDRQELDAAVERLVAEIRGTEPGAVGHTKALLRELATMDVEAGFPRAEALSARLFASPEAAEGIASFREKRPPSWAC